METRKQDIHTKMSMYWADANFLSNKQHGKIIIDKISKTPKNVLFVDEKERQKCTTSHSKYPDIDWQNLLYVVDVTVLTVNDKLTGYEITKVYGDVIPLED